jgi:hypothetical protein
VKDSPGSSIAFKLVALGRPALLDDATAVVRAMTVPAIQRLIDPGLEPMP